MSAVTVEPRVTPEEYLALERVAERKSEFFNGRIYAMAGASRTHNLVVVNLARELSTILRDRPCETYVADMRVKSRNTAAYMYPDLVVVCGEPEFEDTGLDTLLNPVLVIEVLSQSTEAGDRGHKFEYYRGIETLREFVLVAQDRIHIERNVRQGKGWLLTELETVDGALTLSSIGASLPISAIYEKVPLEKIVSP